MQDFTKAAAAATLLLLATGQAQAEPVPAAGWIYSRVVLADNTEGCLARTDGGVFVGLGSPFETYPPPGGTRSVLFVSDGGAVRTVATGLNAISDCEYDAATDTLYVTDNGGEFSGAVSGDTVFAIPGSSTSVAAAGLELLPSGSIPFAFATEIRGSRLFVSDAAGGGAGSVLSIDLAAMTPSATTFATGFDYTGGILADGPQVLVAEQIDGSFDNAVREYSVFGVLEGTLSGPTYDHGSVDMARLRDGSVVVTGAPTIAAIGDSGVETLLTGLDGGGAFDAYGGGVTADAFTGRVEFLASTFLGVEEDRSVHSLTPVDRLVTGGGPSTTDCAMEIYGVELVAPAPGRPAKQATCVDGEACDADGKANGECAFPLGLCFNVPDERLADCTPAGVASVELASVKPDSAAVTALVADAAAAMPLADATCVFGDSLRLPLRVTSGGDTRRAKATVRLRATMDDEAARRDTDAVRLVCEPAP